MSCHLRHLAGGSPSPDRNALYERTTRNPYGSLRLSKRRRRWESVSWWLSSIFAIALVAWALTWWFGIRGDDNGGATADRVITFEVTSAENGQPLAGAQVSYPGGSAPTDADGTVSLAFPDTPVDIETVVTQLQAVAPYPTTPIVRVPSNDKTTIKRYLDTGVQTLLIPMVDTVEDAKAAVSYTRFPDAGFRGVAGATRATRFGRVQNYHRRAHEEICTLIQVESREALTHIEAMEAVRLALDAK